MHALTLSQTQDDQIALLKAVIDGSSNFFFGMEARDIVSSQAECLSGSDSAPHPVQSKQQTGGAAGCFTQAWCTALVIGALEHGVHQGWVNKEEVTLEAVEGFLSSYGRTFYKISKSDQSESRKPRIRLTRQGETIPRSMESSDGGIEVIPFRSGHQIMTLSWVD